MGIGGFFSKSFTEDADHVHLLQLGIELGLNVIDTAEVYGDGHAEELVGRAVTGKRNDVYIVTKFSAQHGRAEEIVSAAEGSLRRLNTDRIDIYMPHWPNPKVCCEETMEALDRLVCAGKVRWLGLSNFGISEVIRASTVSRSGSLIALQHEYSLLERGVEDTLLPFCEREGIVLMAYSPFSQGSLLVRNPRTDPLFVMADSYGVSPAQLALAWLTRHKHVLVVPKAGREHSLRENAKALSLSVAPSDIDILSQAFAPSIELIAPKLIDLTDSADGRKVYKTLDEAIDNRYNMTPSPREISNEIITANGVLQKPIKVRRAGAGDRFILTDGRSKYWGWVIAYGLDAPIPAFIDET
jgi:aryl-alcohol dehydrogenase-like predicted oxidoreductase